MKPLIACLAILAVGCTVRATYTTDGGAYFYPATNSLADVQSAVTAVPSGGTPQTYLVIVPAGTGAVTWGGPSTYLTILHPCTIVFPGPSNLTITLASSSTGNLFHMDAPCVIEGVDIEPVTGIGTYTIFAAADGANFWRVTNVVYNSSAVTSIAYYFVNAAAGSGWGVVDNCVITSGGGNNELIFSRGPSGTWSVPDAMGTGNAIYIENDTFNGPGYVCDCNANQSGVIRFCLITGNMKIDGHGVASNTPAVSVRSMESYGNSFTFNGGSFSAGTHEMRGGTGRIFGETTVEDAAKSGIYLEDYGYLDVWPNFSNIYKTPTNYPIAHEQIGCGVAGTGGDDPYYLVNNTCNTGATPAVWTRDIKGTGYRTFTTSGTISLGATSIVVSGSSPPYAGNSVNFAGDVNAYFISQVTGSSSPWTLTITPGLAESLTSPGVTMSAVANWQTQSGNTTLLETQIVGAPNQEGKNDFYWQTALQWAGTMDGSQGCNYGTSAQEASTTPTAAGVGFFRKDAGTWFNPTAASTTNGILVTTPSTNAAYGILDAAVSNGSGGYKWQTIYQPYQYPHPLVTGRSCGSALVAGHAITIYEP